MAGTILEAKAVILGEDKTGAAFASFARNASSAAKAAAAFNRSSASIASVSNVVASRRMIDGMSESLAASRRMIDGLSAVGRAADEARNKVSLFHRTLGGMSGAVSSAWKNVGPLVEGAVGAGLLHETKRAVEAGADLQSERVRMAVAGIPQPEISAGEQQAFDLAAKYPNMSPAEILQSYKETRSVLLKPSETAPLMDTVVSAKSAMKQLGMGEEAANALQYAVKSAEVLGRAQDPKRFKAYIDSFIRALEVSGKTLTPEDMFHFSQQMKAASVTLSDRFINTVGMSMVQDMGSRAATGLAQFVGMMVGGYSQGQKRSLTDMLQLGMVKRRDLEWGRDGIKGLRPGRHPQHWREAITEPDKYVNDYLVPILKAHGITSLQDQIAEVLRLYPNKAASNIIAKLVQQALSFEQHAVNYGNALGLEGAEKLLHQDPAAALSGFTTSIQTLMSALTSPAVTAATPMLFSLASSIGSFGKALESFDKVHPELAKWTGGAAIAGGLGLGGLGVYKMFSGFAGGFGLQGSATALDGAAAALDAAAAKLGGTSGVPLSKATAAGAGAGAGGAMVAALSTGVTAAVAGGVVALDLMKHDSAHGNHFRTWLRGELGIDDPHEPAPWRPGGAWHKDAPQMLPMIDVASRGNIGHIGESIAEQLSAIADRPVKVDGQAEVTAKGQIGLTAEAQRFFSLVQQLSVVASGILKAGGGSTGTSMPEAQPLRKGYQK
jgi:hypothetical protein